MRRDLLSRLESGGFAILIFIYRDNVQLRGATAPVLDPTGIEHTGTTSVAGLSAKPVIGVLVVLTDSRMKVRTAGPGGG